MEIQKPDGINGIAQVKDQLADAPASGSERKVWTRRTSRVMSKSLTQSQHLNSRVADTRQPQVESHEGQTSVGIISLKGEKVKLSRGDFENMNTETLRTPARRNNI